MVNRLNSANLRISVIINTYNRADFLHRVLLALKEQSYQDFEVVVVDGPSTDHTGTVLAEFKQQIKTARCPKRNLSLSRNIGIEESAGDICVFIDDDALPGTSGWLQQYATAFKADVAEQIGCIGGTVKMADSELFEFNGGATSDYGLQIFRQEEVDELGIVLDGKRWIGGVIGTNNASRRSALYAIGGFDPAFTYYLDETDICFRLLRKGYGIQTLADNFVRHYKGERGLNEDRYRIPWATITRSDTYFSLKHGYDAWWKRMLKTLIYARRKHFYLELKKGQKDGAIPLRRYFRYYLLWLRGFLAGYIWGIFRNKRKVFIKDQGRDFRPYIPPLKGSEGE